MKVVHFPAESVDECLSFQYTVDDSTINPAAANATTAAATAAAHYSPEATAAEATCAFQYFVPSPSPTGPSCSVRLSCGNGAAEVGVNSSRISSPAAMAGRRLEYIERMDDYGKSTKAATAASGMSEPRSSRVEGNQETGRKDSGKTVPVASSSVSVCEGATTSTAAEAPAYNCRQPRATNSPSKGHLFATLMDNIDLSQMTPSQPMQEKDGGRGATRGEKGLEGQELAAAAVSATTTESERRKGGGALGQLQSRSQPEPGERYRGLRSSSSSPRHVRNQAEGPRSPTPLVAPLTDGLWSKSAVGASDTLALGSEDITCKPPPAHHSLTPNKSKSLKTPPPENPRPLPLQPPIKEKTDASETAAKTKVSAFREPNARDRLSPQQLPTSRAEIRNGVSTSNAVEVAVSVTEEGEAAARAGLVDEAKNSRMPPPVRRRLVGGGAAPVVAPTDLTGESWTGRRLGFSGASAPNAEAGKANEQHAGLETETMLEREAVKGGGVVAREMGCVGTVARPRDSVDSTARDCSPSSSGMSSSFNLDLVTTPEVRQPF